MVCIGDYGLLLNWSNRQRYRGRETECAERKIQKETLKGDKGMNKEKILLDLITKLLTKEYVLSEVRRSNSNDKQEYDFVIKKASE